MSLPVRVGSRMPGAPKALSSPNRSKKQPTAVHSDASSDAESSHSHHEYGLLDLDEPMKCSFREGESVWIRLKDSAHWVPGALSVKGARTTATREGTGVAYPVQYKKDGKTRRDYFAPQNGELKPDTPEVRELLAEGGWL
ncbi:hypothetical protein NUW54_g1529 [Trametes sanguinea]|uniref:Uncharacterized protein n=2 Tax=Trametes sanguinea TaxID=158606 RepID=A0ACC1Q964_9APHY|nr:hypothetical protein NUW54_g1558 [Trametes sanguinea]KAJ3013661.1 hypothetical protein NUW54_g1529 [Trametes sanguinea]